MNISPAEAWSCIAAALAAIVLIANASEKIINAVHAAKAPNEKQNERLDGLEERMKTVEARLEEGSDRFSDLAEANKVTQMALLALLDHGIDGNNIEQMRSAKEALRAHLIGGSK